MANENKSTRRDLARMRVVAITKHFTKKSVVIDGVDLGAKDLVAFFQSVIDTEDAVDLANATQREAIKARQLAEQRAARIAKALEGVVGAAYGESSKAFAEFGFVARKRGTKSAETKALAADKLRATRAARHTMGVRQKAALHGSTPPPPAHEPPTTTTNGGTAVQLFGQSAPVHA